MTMALRRWWPFGPAEPRDDSAVREQLDKSHDLRHDVAGKQHTLAAQTEVLKRILDPIEAELAYFAATGRDWRHDDTTGSDDSGGGVRRGDAGDV